MSTLHRLIHGGFRQLGISDDADKRAVYLRVVAKDSLSAMSDAEMQAVADELRHLGYRPTAGAGQVKGMAGKYAKKLQALWIAGWNLGIVRDRRDAALLAFVTRQTGLDHVRFLYHADDGKAAIEALKGWLKREAGVSYGATNGYDWLARDGAKIAWAQWRMLKPTAGLMRREGFDQEAFRLSGRTDVCVLDHMTDADWRTVMNTLGERVRAAKKGGDA